MSAVFRAADAAPMRSKNCAVVMHPVLVSKALSSQDLAEIGRLTCALDRGAVS